MKIRFGYDGIAVEGLESVPSARELCEMDKRLIYVGDTYNSKGMLIKDAFLHVFDPNRFYTIENVRHINDNLFILDTEIYCVSDEATVLQNLYNMYSGEIYVGDVCDGTGKTGEVWHDAYKDGLSSIRLYTKNEDGTRNYINPPIEDCFSVPDRFGFRIVVKTPNEPDKHYAFFYGLSAFNKWTYLQNNAQDGQQILHSIDPNYRNFLNAYEREEFEQYPKLVKAYPKSYSREGFLKLDK